MNKRLPTWKACMEEAVLRASSDHNHAEFAEQQCQHHRCHHAEIADLLGYRGISIHLLSS